MNGRVDPLRGVGEWALFVWRAVKGIGRLGSFAPEVLRQAAIIATGSVLVIMFVTFVLGNSCGFETTAIARSLGADPAAPAFSLFCSTREVAPTVFGFILSAKVGCGIVAELGAMRVDDEVDAIEVMGIPSIPFLVSTRLLGAMIVLPFVYYLATMSAQFGAWVASLVRYGDISQGTWELFFYTAISPVDLLLTLAKGVAIAAFVISTSVYFGYTVRGGPVEVGIATSRSMVVNIVGTAVIGATGTLLFWVFRANVPVA